MVEELKVIEQLLGRLEQALAANDAFYVQATGGQQRRPLSGRAIDLNRLPVVVNRALTPGGRHRTAQAEAVGHEQARQAICAQHPSHLRYAMQRVLEVLQAADVGHAIEEIVRERQGFTVCHAEGEARLGGVSLAQGVFRDVDARGAHATRMGQAQHRTRAARDIQQPHARLHRTQIQEPAPKAGRPLKALRGMNVLIGLANARTFVHVANDHHACRQLIQLSHHLVLRLRCCMLRCTMCRPQWYDTPMERAVVNPPQLTVTRLTDGPPARAPLILLHGFTGDSTTWQPLLPHLGRDRAVLGIDLVGHGQSTAPHDPAAYTMPATVAAVAHTLRRLDIPRAQWLGYSIGGRVALNLALDHPDLVASLILIGTSPGIDDPVARAARIREDEALAEAIEREGLTAFVDRWMAQPLFVTQARLGADHLRGARAQRLRNHPHALALALRGMGTGAMEPVTDRQAEIRAPVLIVTGALDPKFGAIAARMAEVMTDSTSVVIAGAGHAAQIEAPAAVGEAVRLFLQRAEAK